MSQYYKKKYGGSEYWAVEIGEADPGTASANLDKDGFQLFKLDKNGEPVVIVPAKPVDKKLEAILRRLTGVEADLAGVHDDLEEWIND